MTKRKIGRELPTGTSSSVKKLTDNARDVTATPSLPDITTGLYIGLCEIDGHHGTIALDAQGRYVASYHDTSLTPEHAILPGKTETSAALRRPDTYRLSGVFHVIPKHVEELGLNTGRDVTQLCQFAHACYRRGRRGGAVAARDYTPDMRRGDFHEFLFWRNKHAMHAEEAAAISPAADRPQLSPNARPTA